MGSVVHLRYGTIQESHCNCIVTCFYCCLFFPRFGGVVIGINEIHMKFLELFLTHIHIKMHPAKQKHTHTSMYIETCGHTNISARCTNTHTRTHSIPVGGVSTGDLIDCEVHKFQNSKVKHPLLKRLDYFTGVSV